MQNHNTIPTICIVGRPNVGKSSLFNCLLGERKAVVVEQSGTTRDRVEAIININDLRAILVDTGGYTTDETDYFSAHIKAQIHRAMEEASIIILVADSIAGISPQDKEVASMLRKFSKPVIMVANKTDNDKLKSDTVEFYQLGFGHPEEISCLHRRGLKSLKKRLRESIKNISCKDEEQEIKRIKIAIVGRPNVGKSSFVNNMLGKNRVIVSDMPGTTRDSIDTIFNYDGDEYVLIDTAGIRHRRKIKSPVDTFSVMRSKQSIIKADITVLLLDAAEGATRDDIDILRFIEEHGKACLILINKWDLSKDAEDVTIDEYKKHLLYASNILSKFPISFVSAKTGKNVLPSLSIIKILDSTLDFKASTPYLNSIFERNNPSKVPVPKKKKRPNFLYIVQSSQRPVEFKYFVNDPSAVLPSHISFIENCLRDNLTLKGVPVKIWIRKSRKRSKY